MIFKSLSPNPHGNSPGIRGNRVTTVQCLSGTGSLRVGGEFLARHYHQVVDLLTVKFSFTKIERIVSEFSFYLSELWATSFKSFFVNDNFLNPFLAADYIYSSSNLGKSP